MTSELGDSTAVDLRPVPRIDHVMVLLDAATYDEIAASGFLTERFARVKRKDADSSIAGSYATLGIAGQNTLVELFGSAMPGASPLAGGLVFSFEEPGSSSSARALLDASGEVEYHHQLVHRAMPDTDEKQPWYHLISVNLGTGSPMLLFLNEVTPEYFGSIGARPAPDGALRRRAYLDAVLGRPDDGTHLLRDISGITLLVGAERATRISNALTALGYTRSGEVLTGPGLAIRLVPTDGPERVAEVHLDLVPGRRAADTPAELRLGRSRLLIEHDDTARWIFDPASH
ncbi:MAG: DUF5829 family protein [Kibdelosporangium sp.]